MPDRPEDTQSEYSREEGERALADVKMAAQDKARAQEDLDNAIREAVRRGVSQAAIARACGYTREGIRRHIARL